MECHRSQSAIVVRHLNRGEGNFCGRTDLYFRPVSDSKLARKREGRLMKHAEIESSYSRLLTAVTRQDCSREDGQGDKPPGDAADGWDQSRGNPCVFLHSCIVS